MAGAYNCKCIKSRADALTNLPARARWIRKTPGCGRKATKRACFVFGPCCVCAIVACMQP